MPRAPSPNGGAVTPGNAATPANPVTPGRVLRSASFRIPLPPPTSPLLGSGAVSPGASSPGDRGTSSRFAALSLGFNRRARGASASRDLREAAAAGAAVNGVANTPNTSNTTATASHNPYPSPPATAYSNIGPSQSLTDLPSSPGNDRDIDQAGYPLIHPQHQHSNSQQLSSSTSSARSYFPIMTRRGFGRKNSTAVAAGSSAQARTPTTEAPPPLLRSRSSSQPSLPLNATANQLPASPTAAHPSPYSAGPLTAVSGNGFFSQSQQQQQLQSPQSSTRQSRQESIDWNSTGPSGREGRQREVTATAPLASANLTAPTVPASGSGSSRSSMDRNASAAVVAASSAVSGSVATPAAPVSASATTTTVAAPGTSSSTTTSSSAQHIRLVPHLDATRSLSFEPVSREVVPSVPLRIGRFTDRNPNQPVSAFDQYRVAFKSKVVSRTHAEIWFDPSPPAGTAGAGANGGGWFIRDLKSSSGTFLNHIRLSGAGMESRPFPLRGGDILQLGVDYQGGTEEIYRCVKMRVELNRGWQRGVNSFNSAALRQIRAFGNVAAKDTTKGSKKREAKPDETGEAVSKKAKKAAPPAETTDCCICLFAVNVYQALFIAPCSHIFHFKCIRPLVEQHHPGFSCPLCRTFADLEADVEQDDVAEELDEDDEDEEEIEEDGDKGEDILMEGVQPAVPPKDDLTARVVQPHLVGSVAAGSSSHASGSVSEFGAGLSMGEPNLDTLRPGKKSPRLPSPTTTTTHRDGHASPSNAVRTTVSGLTTVSGGRKSLDRVSASPSGSISGRRSGSMSISRSAVNGRQSSPPLPGDFLPPSAGDFDADIRRSSIFVHGADGHAMHIPITGRSRPSSVFEEDIGGDDAPHQAGNTSISSHRARSVRSLKMSMSSRTNDPVSPTARVSLDERHARNPTEYHDAHDHTSSGDDEDMMDPPLTARPDEIPDPLEANRPDFGSPMSVYTAPEDGNFFAAEPQAHVDASRDVQTESIDKGKARADEGSATDAAEHSGSDGSGSSSLDTGTALPSHTALKSGSTAGRAINQRAVQP